MDRRQHLIFKLVSLTILFEDRISFEAGDNEATLSALGLSGLDYTEQDGAQDALELLDEAQIRINEQRSNLGALQNRLQSTSNNLLVSEENLSAANSRIRDTDVAEASAELTRNNILLQAGTAALAQANNMNSVALNLIG